MSYQNPLIIQNNPGGNIGQAANQAAASIQDAILSNMAKQEKKQEEIARKQAIDDANAIAAAKESSTEDAEARKALAANEYSAGGMDAYGKSSEEKYRMNQVVADVNATREDRLAAQDAINAENTFQQNQVGSLAYFSEDKAELATLRAKGNVYSTEGLGGVYVRFLDGNPNVKLSGKRVGNDWVNTLTEDGVTYELPTDKIKDGSFSAFALTPDLYEGIDAQSKEINAARNKREKGMQEFTPNDLSGITEAVNVNVEKAKANFGSYLEVDPIKARAVLTNSIFPEKTKEEIDTLMNNLTSGDATGDPEKPGKYDIAIKEVNAEMTKDIEYKWGMNTGVFRNENSQFEVMKPEEPVNTKSSGGSKESKADEANRLLVNVSKTLDPSETPMTPKQFPVVFEELYPNPQEYKGNEVTGRKDVDGGFRLITKVKKEASLKPVGDAELKAAIKTMPDITGTWDSLTEEEKTRVREKAEGKALADSLRTSGEEQFEEVLSPVFKYTNQNHMIDFMNLTISKNSKVTDYGYNQSATNISNFYKEVNKPKTE
jgi:hypothetical protein